MPPDEEAESNLADAIEGETGDPSPETGAEEGAGEVDVPDDEPQVAERLKDIRKDIYRRQSNLEAKVDQILQNQRSSGPRTEEPSSLHDPVKIRQGLASDPVGTIQNLTQDAARRVIRQERAKDTLLGEFPELKDSTHPFYRKVEEEYAMLQANGNQGPDLALLAAQRAARLHPDLREEGIKETRRKSVENGTKRTATQRVEHGVSKPKQEKEPSISEKEHRTARRFGFDLQNEEHRKRYLAQRDLVNASRIDRPDTED